MLKSCVHESGFSPLFVGPTGMGKAQATTLVGPSICKRDDAVIRFDMNEYGDAAAARLVGHAFRPVGQFPARIRHAPPCARLFAEI